MAYTNTWETHGVYRKFTGRITGMELLRSVERVEGDSRFDLIRYVINDFLDVTEVSISDDEVKLIAAIDNVATLSNSKIKVAQIATNPKIIELATMYTQSLKSTSFPNQLFSTITEARQWIGSQDI